MLRVLFSLFLFFEAQADPSPSNVFDESSRDFFRQSGRWSREQSDNASDMLVGFAAGLPVAYWGLWVAYKTENNPQLLRRIVTTSAQTFMVTGFWVMATKHLVARSRPYVRECESDPSYEADCNSLDSRQSFFSGHSAFSFAGAGLVCYFNENVKSGGGVLSSICPGALTLAATVASFRMMADKHYLTDVIVGGLVGWASGYYFPKFLDTGKSFLTLAPHEKGANIQFVRFF